MAVAIIDPDNIAAGIDVAEYVPDDESPDSVCDGIDIADPCGDFGEPEAEAVEKNFAAFGRLLRSDLR